MRIITNIIVLFFMVLSIAADAQLVDNFKEHVEYLSDDKLQGRVPGSQGVKLAAEYIASHFKSIGLKTLSGQSYYQSFSIPNQKDDEVNVIGIIPAVTPTNLSLVFTAHYDGPGNISKSGNKDSIYNNALDNAVGVAALIEMAKLYKNGKRPRQNIVFIATAAEERGLIGSKYYAAHPIYSLKDISIVLNIDGFCVWGPQEDFMVMPRKGIDFLDKIESIAKTIGWKYDSAGWIDELNKNFDSAPFLQQAVPAITLWTGNKLSEGREMPNPRLGRRAHTPADEINEYWNWDGIEDHIILYKTIADYFLENPGNIKVTDPSLFSVH